MPHFCGFEVYCDMSTDGGGWTRVFHHNVSGGLFADDAEADLKNYPSDSFDYVILSQTLQSIYEVRITLNELLRIGRHAIVSFPNFGYWRVLYDLLVKGRSPISEKLPYIWCDSPNIRFCTMTDFVTLAEDMGFVIDRVVSIDHSGRATSRLSVGRWTNWFAEEAIYLLSRQNQ